MGFTRLSAKLSATRFKSHGLKTGVLLGLVQAALLLVGCRAASEPPAEPCGYPTLEDTNPDPNIVEVTLVAAPVDWDPGTGTLIHGIGFNGSVPGPLLRAKKGDQVIIHFTNRMDAETTIHWHGLRIPNDMDGVHVTQDPIQPGESFEYRFTVPDSGYFWYHPHMAVDLQVERGLYAPFVVDDPDEPRVACDQTFLLDDVLLDSKGQLEPQQEGMAYVMGRLGNMLLVNGKADKRLTVKPGTWQLWRLVNTANARYIDLQVEAHSLVVVGTDGGYLSEPYTVEHLVIAPGERYMVLVHATGEPGKSYAVQALPFELHAEDSMMGEMMGDSDPLGDQIHRIWTLVYDNTPALTPEPPALPQVTLPAWSAGPAVAHTWVLRETMESVSIDGEQYPNVPTLSFPVDQEELYTFEIDNKTEMFHPFHIHGQLFQIVALDDLPTNYLAWKDTFNVPPSTKMTVVGLLNNPGKWLYHCHILEHEELGMMGELDVISSQGAPSHRSPVTENR